MSDTESTLKIKILAEGQLAALTEARERAEALKVGLEGLKVALEAVGVGLTFTAALEGIKNTVEYGASLQHLSEQAGISAQAFQTLAYVAIDAGLKQDALSTSLNVLQRNMAQAAEGATKQNRAIADLGLNTAELLAMPVEQQIEAIGHAYVNSTDRAKAWGDVTALLGRNAAQFKTVLEELGTDGLKKFKDAITISDGDVARLEQTEKFWAKLAMEVKAVAASAVARPGDALAMAQGLLNVNPWSFANAAAHSAVNAGTMPAGAKASESSAPDSPEAHQAKIDQINAQLQATIQAEPQMVAAHQALTKALADENKAYEGPAEAAARMRREAQADMDQAAKLAENKFDAGSQLEAVKLQTAAAQLRTQANAEDAKASREKSQLDLAEWQMAEKKLPIDQQLFDLRLKLAGLNPAELDYLQTKRKLEEEIATLETKGATQAVDDAAKDQELQNKRTAIALAATEHDINTTDTEKWHEKRQILDGAIAAQQQYIANMRSMAGDSSLPQGARDKASGDAAQGENALASLIGQKGAMGADPNSFTQNFSAGITKLRGEWDHLQSDMAHSLTGAISTGLNGVSTNLSKVITGAENLGQAFRNIAVDVGTTLVQAFTDMGVKWIANKITMAVADENVAASSTAALLPIAAAQSAIWAAPATLATIASWGGAALAAPLEILGALAETQAIALGGFEMGGFTGGTEGQVAGIVHGGEYVWSAPAVRAVGVGNLERAHQAAVSGGGSSGGGGGGRGSNHATIINAFDAESVARSQRKYMDARVVRGVGRIPQARVAL
jgi:hypothetical protein